MVAVKMSRIKLLGLALASVALLAACESDEDKAEKYYESGVELLASGDVDRALIEFRNVFKHEPSHREARAAYARAVRDQGRLGEAFSQYLRLVEYYPDHLEGQIALAEMALQSSAIEEFERHARAAGELAPEDPVVVNLMIAADYLDAVRDEDEAAKSLHLARALETQEESADSMALRLIAIDGLMTEQKYSAAIEQIDAAIAADPGRRSLYNTKLVALNALQDADGLGELLREMVDLFPEDEEIANELIRFLIARGDTAGAEEFLRDMASRPDADIEERLVLIRFTEQTKGREAARAEIEAFIAAGHNTLRLSSLLAGYDFEEGRREEAITAVEALVAGAEPSDERRRVQVLLARFMQQANNEVGARAIIEEVLTQDTTMVPALEMRAGWLIEEDRADEAVSELRRALDQEPEDVSVMTLMAQAHLRNGNRALAGDLLALAASTSNYAPGETLRYASFLSRDDKHLQAEEALLNALRRAPGNTEILIALGNTYVAMQDWPRADQVVATLRRSDSSEVLAAADTIHLRVLAGQQGEEEAMQFLEQLAQSDQDTATSANVALVQARARAGDFEGASRIVEQLLAESPDNIGVRLLAAAVDSAAGKIAEAEEEYQAIVAEQPQLTDVWMQLLRLQSRDGRRDEAIETLDQALAAVPGAPSLLWAKASLLEQQGDRTGALGVYEELYERNTGNPIIANNLASLTTQLDTSPEAVERAYRVARRLRGSDVPAFQDTYGWIAYLRGDYDEALSHLEGAAEGLPGDAVVQMHLGLTLAALDRPEEARDLLERAISMAGEQGADQVVRAKEALEAMDAGAQGSSQN